MTFLLTLRAVLRTWGRRLGLIKPSAPYVRDAKLADVINRICCAPATHGAYLVAVETKQAMVQVVSYMQKNGIDACAVTQEGLGPFHTLNLKAARHCMEAAPYKYQVYVMNKNYAVTGWYIPREYMDAWGKVNLLTTFEPREPWASQFYGRLRSLGRVA